MNIKLIFFVCLLILVVTEVNSHTEEDDQYRTKIKASMRGVLKGIRRFMKAAEKFTAKMFDKFILKTSVKAGEKLTMKTSEKLAIKVVEKVAAKGTVKFVGKTASKLVKRLHYVNVVAGFAFGLWRIVDDPDDWHSYILAAGEVTSGITTMIPEIGTYVSAAIDAGLLAYDLKYAEHDHPVDKESEHIDHSSEL